MATFNVNPNAGASANLSVADLNTLTNGTYSNQTSTSYTLTSPDGTVSFLVTGTGFAYASGHPTSGTITAETYHSNTYNLDI